MSVRTLPVLAVILTLVGITACAPDEPPAADGTLTIAVVDNGDLLRMQELSQHFTDAHPDITLEWVTLDEGELRQQVTTDIATGAGQYDVVALGAYETTIWAEHDWLVPMEDLDADYDVDDLLPVIREALSVQDTLYALPFYGESSFTMYRTDLFAAAGLEMPTQPTWEFLLTAAERLAQLDQGYGVCLRGAPGWGENMAMVTAMANSFGGRWFDEEWRPQLDTPAWQEALDTYVKLGEFAPPDAEANGYNENLKLFQDGECGIWVDATAAASFLSDSAISSVADHVGFAPAPTAGGEIGSNWLWAWSLAIPTSSQQQVEALEFVSWATSAEYTELVAAEYGWLNAPPGTRSSLYQRPEYREAAPFAPLVLEAISSANVKQPTAEPVPYTGIQYVAIPEFQGIGTAVGNQVADALAGRIGVAEALANSQWVTEKVSERTRLTNDPD